MTRAGTKTHMPRRRTITPSDAEWPAPLNELGPHVPPEKLRLRGARLNARNTGVAIVGSRTPTAAGVEVAERLARGLAQAGLVIISGMALGVDTVAHRAALEAGGRTIAVLGCGLDVTYPLRNAALRKKIEASGTIVSEYEDGDPPHGWHFPERNRIIAGLAMGVVFVEGGENSGGLITARRALDANRSVFAVPGSVRNPMAAGPNELIRRCQATLVTDVSHIFEELALEVPDLGGGGTGEWDLYTLTADEARVLGFLDDAPVVPDAVCDALGIQPGRVGLVMSRLEVRGLVVRRHLGYEITRTGAQARTSHRIVEEPQPDT